MLEERCGRHPHGGYEPNPKPRAVSGIPEGFHYTLLDSDFDHFEQIPELAPGPVPTLQMAGIKMLTSGLVSSDHDSNFILGETPRQPGFLVGGFNDFGSALGGGLAWRWRNGSPRESP